MIQIALTTVGGILGTIGTLPVGDGATIVIFGGIFALGVSLVWSMLCPREAAVPAAIRPTRPRVARPPQRRPVAAAVVQSRQRNPHPHQVAAQVDLEVPDWLELVGRNAEQSGFGRMQVLRAARHATWVRLGACRSCHSRAARATGCEVERYGIESAVRRHVPAAQVAEVSCRARNKRDCVFEIRVGGDE